MSAAQVHQRRKNCTCHERGRYQSPQSLVSRHPNNPDRKFERNCFLPPLCDFIGRRSEKPVLLFILSNTLAEISSALQDFINPDSIERRDAVKRDEICIPGISLEPAKNIHLEAPVKTCPTLDYTLKIPHCIQGCRFSRLHCNLSHTQTAHLPG